MDRLLGVAVAALVASAAGFAQPGLDPEKQLVDRISELRSDGGPTTAGLIEPLRALALLYQESSDDALATVAFEEARYVTRVHQGLASADEALLLRLQIRSETEIGDLERVRELEQEMVTIARRHHDDPRMLPIFREVIDDRLALIEQVRVGERPRMIYVRCYNGEPLPPYDYTRGQWLPPVPPAGTTSLAAPSCIGGTNSQIADKLRDEALMYYADAIDVILRTGDYGSEELRELEKTALRIAYFRGGLTLSAREVGRVVSVPLPGGNARSLPVDGDPGFVSGARPPWAEFRHREHRRPAQPRTFACL